MNRKDFKTILNAIGFSQDIQNKLFSRRLNGKTAKVVDHLKLLNLFEISSFTDRKRLLVFFDRLSDENLGWLVDSVGFFEQNQAQVNSSSFSSSSSSSSLSSVDDGERKIEEILSYQLDNKGEMVGWNRQQVKEWITSSSDINDLEPFISPLHLTGFVLNHSSDQELDEFIKPSLPHETDFLAFMEELKAMRPVQTTVKEPKKFNVKLYLQEFEASDSCEGFLRSNKDRIDIQEFDEMMTSLCNSVRKIIQRPNPFNLTPDEIFAVVGYTFENQYAPRNSLYEKLSQVLRMQNPANAKDNVAAARNALQPWKGFLYYLIKGLEKLPPTPGKVYRGVSFASQAARDEMAASYKVERLIEWFGFSSSSTKYSAALGFAQNKGPHGILFEIKLNFGRDVEAYSVFPDEKELLMLPNTSLFVHSHRFDS